jgi:hypothetical protein
MNSAFLYLSKAQPLKEEMGNLEIYYSGKHLITVHLMRTGAFRKAIK